MHTPISVLLFLVHANAVPYQPNNENGRFDPNVDGIDSLIDRMSIESPIEGIGREKSMPIPGGIPISRRDEGKN